MERLYQYALLMRLNRPIGILLLLWPTLWAVWIASNGKPDIFIIVIFITGVILMRSSGCVINDFADRKIDPYVDRTRNRPLATGRVSERESLILFLILCLSAFGLVLLLNILTILLSLVGVLLAGTYPFVKRYTHLPQVYLGMAFAWSIPMAFAAEQNTIPILAWELFLANVLWTVAYDTMYAMADREDDLKIGVKSTAILFGKLDKTLVFMFQMIMLLILWVIGKQLHFATEYFLGLMGAGMLVLYQQWLIKDRQPFKCFHAFLNNNWVGALIFMGIAGQYYNG
jgi:4-hydroxybenzoate polyprenyltransferase